jgi:hypothetical protein
LDLPIALDLQSGSLHRLPPPCATHLSDLPIALALQSGSLQRFPPPCATHLPDLPSAPFLQSCSLHLFRVIINYYYYNYLNFFKSIF